MAKKETWEQEKKRVQQMSEKDFQSFCYKNWEERQARITNSEDSMPFQEFYSEESSVYGRRQPYQ